MFPFRSVVLCLAVSACGGAITSDSQDTSNPGTQDSGDSDGPLQEVDYRLSGPYGVATGTSSVSVASDCSLERSSPAVGRWNGMAPPPVWQAIRQLAPATPRSHRMHVPQACRVAHLASSMCGRACSPLWQRRIPRWVSSCGAQLAAGEGPRPPARLHHHGRRDASSVDEK